ncbi:MAG: hypothetical protein K8T26_01800 [Lentisphaerae bacterium]|nr:hypothetical protein [Lentisphaerota bacterium]
MRWRTILAWALGLFNLPWVLLWWHFSSPALERGPSVTALYMILMICTVGMILLPIFLGGLAGKRWLLTLILGFLNLFWCLLWLQVFANTTPADASYAIIRRSIVKLMLLTSLSAVLLYHLSDQFLRWLAERRAASPRG